MAIPDPQSPDPQRPPTMAGGCLIAAGAIIGPVIGLMFGQTTAGLVGGLAIGAVAAIIFGVVNGRR